jgi:hypothetical protein
MYHHKESNKWNSLFIRKLEKKVMAKQTSGRLPKKHLLTLILTIMANANLTSSDKEWTSLAAILNLMNLKHFSINMILTDQAN